MPETILEKAELERASEVNQNNGIATPMHGIFRVTFPGFSLLVVVFTNMLRLSNSLHVGFDSRFWKTNVQSFVTGKLSTGSSSPSLRCMSFLVGQAVDRKTVTESPAIDRLNVAADVNPSAKLDQKQSAGQYQFSHTELPEETMYIFDGTAMLFSAYFTGEALANGNYVNKNPKYAMVGNGTAQVVPALLSEELNKKIVSSMSDAQVRAMMDSFNAADLKSRAKAAAASEATADTTTNNGDSGKECVVYDVVICGFDVRLFVARTRHTQTYVVISLTLFSL